MLTTVLKYGLTIAVVIVIAHIYQNVIKTRTLFEIPKATGPFDSISLNITILGTNDIHSSFTGMGLKSYPNSIIGDYSRLLHLINDIKTKKENEGDIVLTLDAGDWYSGSLFDNLAAHMETPSIPQLQYFSDAQYDAIILGNHDFDRYESALYTMFNKAHKLGLEVNILASNLVPLPKSSKFKNFTENKSSVRIIPHLIKEIKYGRVGVLGYTTPDALFVSNDYRSELQFVGFLAEGGEDMQQLIELATTQSAALKKEHGCDIVIAVIHGGHEDKEDDIFVAIPDIDIVLGGHTHERYFYKTIDNCFTSQCGHSGMYLTALSVGLTNNNNLVYRGIDSEYSAFVEEISPQCIKVTSEFKRDPRFAEKIKSWSREITELTHLDHERVVHRGDLSGLYNNSATREANTQTFANMLTDQFNKWQDKTQPDEDRVFGVFWTKHFLKIDQFNQDSRDVTLLYSDAYGFIFFTATNDVHSFYVRKEHLYLALQGIFVINKLVSPLLTLTFGGITYDESFVLGVPIITNIQTTQGVPYAEWPPLIRVIANSIAAPYLWKVDMFTYGIFSNFPRDANGHPVALSETVLQDAPTEIELFLNYLQELSANKQ